MYPKFGLCIAGGMALVMAAGAALAGEKAPPKPSLPPSYVSDPGSRPKIDPDAPALMTLAGSFTDGQFLFSRTAGGQSEYVMVLEAAGAELDPKLAAHLRSKCSSQKARAIDCTFMLRFNVAECAHEQKETDRTSRIVTRCSIKKVQSLLSS